MPPDINSTTAMLAEESVDIHVVLATISHPDLTVPIRVANFDQNITSNGNLFIALPFDVVFANSQDGSPPTASIKIDNVSRTISEQIKGLTDQPKIRIEVVRFADPDTIQHNTPLMRLTTVPITRTTVTGDLSLDNLTQEPLPARTMTPALFPGLF